MRAEAEYLVVNKGTIITAIASWGIAIACIHGRYPFPFLTRRRPPGGAQEGLHTSAAGGDRAGAGFVGRPNVRVQQQDQGQGDQGNIDEHSSNSSSSSSSSDYISVLIRSACLRGARSSSLSC